MYECRRLKMFPSLNVESLKSLDQHYCFSLEKFLEILGIMKLLSIIHLEPPLTELDFKPRTSSKQRFNEFPNLNMAEGFCSFKNLNLSGNNFEHLPRSIVQLGALRSLNLTD
uniref:Uncharacterized protein n=1 Tax=Solanum lycopersicum TaxID=4081 RepID=K4BZR7_SOLLC